MMEKNSTLRTSPNLFVPRNILGLKVSSVQPITMKRHVLRGETVSKFIISPEHHFNKCTTHSLLSKIVIASGAKCIRTLLFLVILLYYLVSQILSIPHEVGICLVPFRYLFLFFLICVLVVYVLGIYRRKLYLSWTSFKLSLAKANMVILKTGILAFQSAPVRTLLVALGIFLLPASKHMVFILHGQRLLFGHLTFRHTTEM